MSTRADRRAADQLYAQARTQNHPCWRCGQPIQYDAPRGGFDPSGAFHPRAFTVGHIIERAAGGALTDPTNLAAECAACNYSAGATFGNRHRLPPPHIRTSRDW